MADGAPVGPPPGRAGRWDRHWYGCTEDGPRQSPPASDPWPVLLLAGGAIGVGLQVVHLGEHVSQVVYWIGHPGEPPWMSPLGHWVHHRAMTAGLTTQEAAESMHLAGNVIFLAGLGCLWRSACRWCATLGRRRLQLLRSAWVLEAAHCAEHVLLTASTALTGRAVGLSTGFGLLPAGPGAWTYRVWWHFLANLAPILLVVAAFTVRGAGEPIPRRDPAGTAAPDRTGARGAARAAARP